MNWISKLERKFGKYAIHDLPIYIVTAYAAGFMIELLMPEIYTRYLSLNVDKILHGQVWRVLTFVMQPPSTSLIFIIFALYLYLMIGRTLERAWGSFRFNLFFFSGVLFHVAGAFAAYFVTKAVYGYGLNFDLGTTYLNLSMFFAFAALYPDVQLLLFFMIPIKIKWLAFLDGAFFAYSIVVGLFSGSAVGVSQALAALLSLANFLIFFLSSRKTSPVQNYRQKKRQQEFYAKTRPVAPAGAQPLTRHKCCICGCTELTAPDREFRYCSKCSGAKEYCNEHLFTHTHM